MPDPFEEVGEGLGRVLAPLFAWCIGVVAIAGIISLLGIAVQSILSFLLQPPVLITIVTVIGALYLFRRHHTHEKGAGGSKRLYEQAQAFSRDLGALDNPTDVLAHELSASLGFTPTEDFVAVAVAIYKQEDFGFAEPPGNNRLVEHAAYRDAVREKLEALSLPNTHQLFVDALINALAYFRLNVPASDDTTFTAPAIDLMPDVREPLRILLANFFDQPIQDRHLFGPLRYTVYENMKRVSERHLSAAARKAGELMYPKDHPGTPREIIDDYLTGTPLRDLFFEPMPFGFPQQLRLEHTHIVAGSGHGKTQTLQHLILSDLTRPDPPGLVIIDSQGDMLEKLSRLSLFEPGRGALVSRLIIIDPRDVLNPPALNMFDVNFDRMGRYGPAAREQILNGVIELYDYMFGSLLGAELTQKQSVIFRYLARLMLTIPSATIHDLVKLMQDATPYLQYIEALPPGARAFFETEFADRQFAQTKKQIQRRLWGILENPTFERMFTAPKNTIDMFDALNTGKVVLVNTSKDFLKAERSSFLGRFFIALTLQAVLERAALPEGGRRPAFLYIDEAADYFDDNIDDLLTQARKYQLGVVFAHQYLDQLRPNLRASIAANTSIKLAGGVSTADARSLAPDMRTSPDFILGMHKGQHDTQFATFLRNRTPRAVTVTVPFGSLERQPTMSPLSYDALIRENRARVSPQAADEPIVRLHEPDLPWKLEPHAPPSETARSRTSSPDRPRKSAEAPSMSPEQGQALLQVVTGDVPAVPPSGKRVSSLSQGSNQSPSQPTRAFPPLVASTRDRPAPPFDEVDWSG